jgi:ADP-ribose pyrophosphatase
MEFTVVNEKELADSKYSPLNVVFTLVESKEGYMIVQNSKSNYWELPAGKIKTDETFRDCAIRRCRETSGQEVVNLKLVGVCKIIFENREKYEHFAIYSAELEREMPYTQNSETIDMRWYKPGQEINKLCTTCNNIIRFYESM